MNVKTFTYLSLMGAAILWSSCSDSNGRDYEKQSRRNMANYIANCGQHGLPTPKGSVKTGSNGDLYVTTTTGQQFTVTSGKSKTDGPIQVLNKQGNDVTHALSTALDCYIPLDQQEIK